MPPEELERLLQLYRERYQGFSARHFHQHAVRKHGVKLSCSFVKKALQERVVVELKAAGIRDLEAANRYLEEEYIPMHNELFAVEPKDPESLFVPLCGVDLDHYLCVKEQRVVGLDNVVRYKRRALQLPKQRDRATCARLRVTVHEHIDGRITV